jgi:hypothetical protein
MLNANCHMLKKPDAVREGDCDSESRQVSVEFADDYSNSSVIPNTCPQRTGIIHHSLINL